MEMSRGIPLPLRPLPVMPPSPAGISFAGSCCQGGQVPPGSHLLTLALCGCRPWRVDQGALELQSQEESFLSLGFKSPELMLLFPLPFPPPRPSSHF